MTPPTESIREEDVFLLPNGSALVPRLVVPRDAWGRWSRLLELLASGRLVPVSAEAAHHLLESRPVRSESRAGFVVDIGGRLVRLWVSEGQWWGEALPPPSSSCSVGHLVECVVSPDGWEVLVCLGCGAAW